MGNLKAKVKLSLVSNEAEINDLFLQLLVEKREQAVGSSDPEDEDVETDEVKAKQLADQEVGKIEKVKKLARFQNPIIISSFLKFRFQSHNITTEFWM